MISKVLCPTCGHAILPPGMPEDEDGRCTCQSRTADANDTVAAESTSSADKVCIICGTDLSGKKRYRDHAGHYWCPGCTKADKKKKQKEAGVTCPDCGRSFPSEKLIPFELTKVCAACHAHRAKNAKKVERRGRVSNEYAKEDRRRLVKLILAAAALLAIALLNYKNVF